MKLFFLFFGTILIACNLQAAIIHIPADYPTIQEGIDHAHLGDTVLVQPGTYIETIWLWKPLTLASLYLFTQDTTYISQTIIDGDMQGSGILIIPFLSGDITIQGFTIQHGLGSGPGGEGGGICYPYESSINDSITLEHLVIRNNQGGGIFLKKESHDSLTYVLIRDVVLDSNSGDVGGGLYCENLDPILQNVECKWNYGGCRGGGCFFENSNPVLQNVLLFENFACCMCGGDGGGAYFTNSNPVLNNVVVAGNMWDAMHFYNSSPTLDNVTITNHIYGGIICDNSHLAIRNSILWDNVQSGNHQIILHGSDTSSCTISYCDIQDGENGIGIGGNSSLNWLNGNFQYDPLFLELSDPPFQLSDFSSCIDAGSPDTTGLNLPDGDLLGNQRIWDGNGDGIAIVDMGAYEYNSVPVGIKNPEHKSQEFEVQSYPNPFSDQVNVEFEVIKPSRVLIQLMNSLRNILWTNELGIQPSGKHTQNLDIRHLASGIYFCKLQVGDQFVVERLIKL